MTALAQNPVMAVMTIRDLDDEVRDKLRIRAAHNKRSMEAEVRAILESAVRPQGCVKLGSLLVEMGRQAKLSDEEFVVFEQVRDRTPAGPVSFE